MSPAVELLHGELTLRRERLAGVLSAQRQDAFADAGGRAGIAELLLQVDAALERLDDGSFGTCLVCYGSIDESRLLREPLATVCLECMTPEQSKALERDLETASRFQATLLPERRVRHGEWEGAYLYEPSGAVSGDTVDWIAQSGAGGPLDILFGDVAGKGVAASLLQSNLRALFRALACPELGPGELLTKVNRLFREATTPSAYATLLTLRLGPGGTVELANAGHLPALRAGGGVVGFVDSPSLPVGLFPDVAYGTRRLDIARGETLLLYTDGLTEPARAGGEEFGRDRALAAFAAAVDRPLDQLLAAVRGDLETFLAGRPRTDDLALLALRRQA